MKKLLLALGILSSLAISYASVQASSNVEIQDSAQLCTPQC